MSISPLTPRVNSTPTSSATDLAAHSTHMRRWTFLMIGGTLLLAGGFVGVQIYLMKSSSRTRDEGAGKTPPAWTNQTPLSRSHPVPTPVVDTPSKSDPHETMLDAISGLTRAHLSQTYLNIGLLADAAEKQVYSFVDANNLLDEINNFIDEVERQFIQLPPSLFKTEEDRKYMEQARSVTTLLRAETKELKAYWATGDVEHAARFQKAREEAGAGIEKLTR
jgi:hypothetical protein